MRHLSSPFSGSWCTFYMSVFLFLATHLVLVHLELSIFLCLSMRFPGKFHAVDEQFGRVFVMAFNMMMSFLMVFAVYLPFMPNFFLFDFCIGVCSDVISKAEIVLLSLALVIFVIYAIVIWTQRRHLSHSGNEAAVEAIAINAIAPLPANLSGSQPKESLVDSKTLGIVLVSVLLCLPLVGTSIHSRLDELGPNSTIVLTMMALVILVYPCSIYLRKKHLRETLWREFREHLC